MMMMMMMTIEDNRRITLEPPALYITNYVPSNFPSDFVLAPQAHTDTQTPTGSQTHTPLFPIPNSERFGNVCDGTTLFGANTMPLPTSDQGPQAPCCMILAGWAANRATDSHEISLPGCLSDRRHFRLPHFSPGNRLLF